MGWVGGGLQDLFTLYFKALQVLRSDEEPLDDVGPEGLFF